MRLDGALREDKLGGDFPISAPTRQLKDDVELPGSQPLELQPQAVTLLPCQVPQAIHELPGDLRVEERPPVTDGPDGRGKAADGDVLQHVAGGTGYDSLQCPAITEPVRHDNDLNRRQGLLDEACGLQAISLHVLIDQNHVWLELASKTDYVIDGFGFADHLDTFDIAQQRADPLPDKCEVICYEDSDMFVHTYNEAPIRISQTSKQAFDNCRARPEWGKGQREFTRRFYGMKGLHFAVLFAVFVLGSLQTPAHTQPSTAEDTLRIMIESALRQYLDPSSTVTVSVSTVGERSGVVTVGSVVLNADPAVLRGVQAEILLHMTNVEFEPAAAAGDCGGHAIEAAACGRGDDRGQHDG